MKKVKECTSPEDYLNHLQRIIKLNYLYKIEKISNLGQESQFCAVVLKANDREELRCQGQ